MQLLIQQHLQGRGRIGRWLGGIVVSGEGIAATKAVLAAAVQEVFVEYNAGEPGRKTGPPLEPSQLLVGFHPGALHGLFRAGRLVEQGDAGPAEALVVAAHPQFEQLLIARQYSAINLRVGKRSVRQTGQERKHRAFFGARGPNADSPLDAAPD